MAFDRKSPPFAKGAKDGAASRIWIGSVGEVVEEHSAFGAEGKQE
jgi:hypothetical protein